MHLVFFILVFFFYGEVCESQPNIRVGSAYNFDAEILNWCTISQEEQKKCLHWSQAIRDINYGSYRKELEFEINCKMAPNKDQCLNMISNDRAHLTTLDPGDIFIGGRHNSLIPIMSEKYGPDNGYYAVAVVKKQSQNTILAPLDLKNMHACFPGVGSMAGWVVPMAHLLDEELLTVKDCNNMVKTAANFFNDSCAPNSLIDKHNPSGDNPQSMCELCSSRCSGSSPYMNFDGALKCLSERGDVAFLKHTTVEMMVNHYSHNRKYFKHEFELLCPKSGRAPLSNYRSCNWGFIPAHAVVAVSSILPEKRQKIQEFLRKCVLKFSFVQNQPNIIPYQGSQQNSRFSNTSQTSNQKSFIIFGDIDDRYGDAVNLLFSDETTDLVPIEESQQTFSRYLSTYLHYFEKLRKCPVPSARLCVVSQKEFEKCNFMRNAFAAKLLKPDLSCVVEHSSINCMKAIKDGFADLAVLDAGDIYKAGQLYNLMPIVSEQYDLEEPSYYVIAIAKQSDKDTDLLYLKGKRSCHTGFNKAAGWVMPMSFLLTNNRIRPYGCDSSKAASEFFQKSCVPGVLSSDYGGTSSWSFANLCDLCHGSSSHFCSRSAAEPFYGDTGALRCLVEGGGQIAFAKHTTILENTGYRNPSWWSRNVIPDDFELLCRDGSRAKFNEFERCNLGKVSANAIVTSKDRKKEHVEAYVNLFLIAQQLYGSKYSEDFTFKMFTSEDEVHDLIFQDATSQLKPIPEHRRNYEIYLGHEFLKSMKVVDCTAGAASVKPLVFISILLVLIPLLFFKRSF